MKQEDRIRVTCSVTRNLGNYNSLRVEASRETSVSNLETVEAAYARAWETVEHEVESKIKEAMEDS